MARSSGGVRPSQWSRPANVHPELNDLDDERVCWLGPCGVACLKKAVAPPPPPHPSQRPSLCAAIAKDL